MRRTPLLHRRLRSLVRASAALVVAGTVAACGGYRAPETAPAQMDFGVEMARQGLWAEALFRFEQASRRSPSDAEVLNNLAVAHEALGQFDEALDAYQRAIRAAPSNKELKRNYSRFVEFYRSFRPETPESE